MNITCAGAPELDEVRALFREYAASLHFNLCFQNFEKELEELPGCYGPPAGRLLLARVKGEAAGCVGLRDLGQGIGEMKRLYVRKAFRGCGIGRRLAMMILDEARAIGYTAVRLDTIEAAMGEATALYRSMGFQEIGPYYHNPVPGALFMELRFDPFRVGRESGP